MSDTVINDNKPELREGEATDSAVENSFDAAENSSPVAVENESTQLSEENGDTEPTVEADSTYAEALPALTRRVEYLAGLFEEANRISQDRERIIDRLHSENQQLRLGELQQAMLPLFRDLVRLFDDLQQTGSSYADRSEVRGEDVAKDFQCYRDSVADILYRYGVERYTAAEGVTFNSKEHKALGSVPTSEPSKDRTIARSIRDGFRNETRIIRILEAEVYRFTAEAPPANESDAQHVEGSRQ
jgi:molecular chaperone GrpE